MFTQMLTQRMKLLSLEQRIPEFQYPPSFSYPQRELKSLLINQITAPQNALASTSQNQLFKFTE